MIFALTHYTFSIPFLLRLIYSDSGKLEKDSNGITDLRDAIFNGSIQEVNNILVAKDAYFPVESAAKDIFVRDFYPVFFEYFLH